MRAFYVIDVAERKGQMTDCQASQKYFEEYSQKLDNTLSPMEISGTKDFCINKIIFSTSSLFFGYICVGLF